LELEIITLQVYHCNIVLLDSHTRSQLLLEHCSNAASLFAPELSSPAPLLHSPPT